MTTTNEVNLLLKGLTQKGRNNLLAQCEVVDLAYDVILCEPDLVFRFVYFPLNGFISLVAKLDGHPPLEIGLIGNEGMLGATLILGINASPLHAVVQGSGAALRITVPNFKRVLKDNPSVQRMINQYLYVSISQLSRAVTCIHFHEVESRLARWLLMIHDRVHADHFHFTHQFLADMLGVQRSAITIAASSFQKRNLIRYSRGEITMLDRKGLEAVSCGCYEALCADYLTVFPS